MDMNMDHDHQDRQTQQPNQVMSSLEQITSTLRILTEQTRRIQEENHALRGRMDDLEVLRTAAHTPLPAPRPRPTPAPAPVPAQVPAPVAVAAPQPKKRLPDVPTFDGSDKTLYPQFVGLLRAKLNIDGALIGDEEAKIWYMFGRLSGDASTQIYPWIPYALENGEFTVENFFHQMRLSFADPRAQQKALAKINRTKQGNRPFNEFLVDFNRLILEAEGWGWDDRIKKGYLKAAISIKLMTAFVGKEEAVSYPDFCDQLRQVDDQQAEIAELTARRSNWRKPVEQRTTAGEINAAQHQDNMDWEPTKIAAGRTREPRWASPEEVARRKTAGLCLRCGKEGHRVKDCRATLPTNKTKVAAAAAAAATAAPVKSAALQIEELEDEDSGKE